MCVLFGRGGKEEGGAGLKIRGGVVYDTNRGCAPSYSPSHPPQGGLSPRLHWKNIQSTQNSWQKRTNAEFESNSFSSPFLKRLFFYCLMFSKNILCSKTCGFEKFFENVKKNLPSMKDPTPKKFLSGKKDS